VELAAEDRPDGLPRRGGRVGANAGEGPGIDGRRMVRRVGLDRKDRRGEHHLDGPDDGLVILEEIQGERGRMITGDEQFIVLLERRRRWEAAIVTRIETRGQRATVEHVEDGLDDLLLEG